MAARWALLANGGNLDEATGADKILAWDDSSGNGQSLSAFMHERLFEIRTEHMRWAYETGLKNSNGLQDRGSIAEALECGARPSMWWTSILYERHPKISPNLYPLYKLRALEMLLEAERPESLLLLGGDSLLKTMAGNLCARLGIGYDAKGKAASTSTGWKQKIYRKLPAPLRALLRFFHWGFTVWRHLPTTRQLEPLAYSPAGGKSNMAATIVAYFPNIDLQAAANGHFYSRYWESLHGVLNREARRERPTGGHFARWLFIRFPSPQLSFAQCLKFCGIFSKKGRDGLSFNYLEEFLAPKDLAAAFWRWLKLCVASFRLRKEVENSAVFVNSRLNFWPLIKWDYGESFQGWRSLERCLQNRAFENYFKLAGAQRWHLFPLENCPWERMFTSHARNVANNGPVFGAQHSMVRPTDFRYFDDPAAFSDKYFSPLQPDMLGGNGSSALDQWLANGAPESRIVKLEALRYLYLAEQDSAQARSENCLPGGEPLESCAEKGHLLVLTSFFADETGAHLNLLRQCMEAGALEGWQISIKPHPVLSVQAWLEALPAAMRKKIMVLNAPLATLLRPGELVWCSNSTTAALEAALKRLPLMVMAPVNDFDLCPIQNVRGLFRTASVEDVKKFLENPQAPDLPKGYLDLTSGLCAWKKLLGIAESAAQDPSVKI